MEKTIQEKCASLLIEKGLKIAVAESCTGGLICSKLTDIPGSSAFMERGFVTYSNHAKVSMLGVSESVIKEHGAVSEETALGMAKGALDNSDADIALAVTGIAGPTGGTKEKPVGTVFIALAKNDDVRCEKFNFTGGRLSIKQQTLKAALNMLHDECVGI